MKKRTVNILTGGGGRAQQAFTMAEILLSLTIIGVVAAITLPSLTGNINERTWSTQRKAIYARFSQAIALMPALNGYGTLDDTTDTAAETFVTAGLSKVLKINNICDNEHLADCGIPAKITTLNAGSTIDTYSELTDLKGLNSMFDDGVCSYNSTTYTNPNPINTKSVAFETQNGESILTFYNPKCQGNMNEKAAYYTQSKMCANFIYDLNGNKGPNTVGKDIGFLSILYSTDPVAAAPIPLRGPAGINGGNSLSLATRYCREQDAESRIPTREELAAMFYNLKLIGVDNSNGFYWSSTRVSSTETWRMFFGTGIIQLSGNSDIWCVKR